MESIKNTIEHLKKIRSAQGRLGRHGLSDQIMKELIQRGLVAGDYSRAYLTDAGDSFLENPQAATFLEELRKI